jgi:hypothetical protein
MFLGLHYCIQLALHCNVTIGEIRNVNALPLLLVLVLLLLIVAVTMGLVLGSVPLKTVALAFRLRVHTLEKHF